MSFRDDLKRFSIKVERRERDVFTGLVDLAHESIQTGSAITGAPGQPVDTGNLRASWQKEYVSRETAVISTNVVYAEPIEDGVGQFGPLTLRSQVGGFHSVALTVASADRMTEHVVRKVVGSDGR